MVTLNVLLLLRWSVWASDSCQNLFPPGQPEVNGILGNLIRVKHPAVTLKPKQHNRGFNANLLPATCRLFPSLKHEINYFTGTRSNR